MPPRPARKQASRATVAGLSSVPAIAEPVPDLSTQTALFQNELGDDRESIHPGDRVLLIVDNDENFARFLLDLAREHGFKGLVSASGAGAVAMAKDFQPN